MVYFTDHYHITFTRTQGWFDPILEKDCKVFIDPLLVYKNKEPEFINSQEKITKFFVDAFALVKESIDDSSNANKRKKTLQALSFSEVEELGLGLAVGSTQGRGTGKKFAELIFEALENQLSASVDLDKKFAFETISLFADNIGADRISDMVATLLKEEIILYTQRICKEYNVPTEQIGIKASKYDFTTHCWKDGYYDLPVNPYNKRMKAVLLVPKNFLRAKISITQTDFKHFLLDTKDNEDLREEFGTDIITKVKMSAKKIMQVGIKNFQLIKDYVDHVISDVKPYDFELDENSLYRIQRDAELLSKKLTVLPKIETEEEFKKAIQTFCLDFKQIIEGGIATPLLWIKKEPRKEKHVQSLFSCLAVIFGKLNNVDISPEVSSGRGAIDFKISIGYEFRALVEIKLVSNSKWQHGLESQLPTYLESEKVKIGHFVSVAFNDPEIKKFQILPKILDDINKKYAGKFVIVATNIDARKKPSASIKEKIRGIFK